MKKQAIIFTLMICSIGLAVSQPAHTSKQRGSVLYKKYCLTCHQADGSGVPRMNPPLIKTSYVNGDNQKLIQWVLKGSVKKVPIDGENYSNKMPPQNSLTDQQIADVLTFIRSSFGNNASAILPLDVKTARTVIK